MGGRSRGGRGGLEPGAWKRSRSGLVPGPLWSRCPAASGTWPRRGWSAGCSDSLEYHGPGGDEAQTTDPPAVPATSEGAE